MSDFMNEYLPYKLYFLYSIKTNYTSVVIVRALAEKAGGEKIGKNYLCSRKPFLSHDLRIQSTPSTLPFLLTVRNIVSISNELLIFLFVKRRVLNISQ
jgi:hypothetical protein